MATKKKVQVPEPALRRLPWYLALVKLMKDQGVKTISSTTIAKSIGVDSALVAKDLSYVTISGKTRVGYDVAKLTRVLENFLGFNASHKAYIFGAGNLGAALILDKGLMQYGLEIVAGFDTAPKLCGTDIGGVPIYHINRLSEVKEDDVNIGVLTVPIHSAQEVTDFIVEHGICAIWNFTPFRISVPEGVVVQNTSMYSHLAVMFNRLKNLKKHT